MTYAKLDLDSEQQLVQTLLACRSLATTFRCLLSVVPALAAVGRLGQVQSKVGTCCYSSV